MTRFVALEPPAPEASLRLPAEQLEKSRGPLALLSPTPTASGGSQVHTGTPLGVVGSVFPHRLSAHQMAEGCFEDGVTAPGRSALSECWLLPGASAEIP